MPCVLRVCEATESTGSPGAGFTGTAHMGPPEKQQALVRAATRLWLLFLSFKVRFQRIAHTGLELGELLLPVPPN